MNKLRFKILLYIFLVTFIFTQDMVINKISVIGLKTVTEKQIYRSSGLFPSEEYIDDNDNNKFDIGENYIDLNSNGFYDAGTMISKGDEINLAIKNLWSYGVFSDVQIYILNSTESILDIEIIINEIPLVNKIIFKGNKNINEKTLVNLLLIEKEQRLIKNKIKGSISNIKNEYSKKGFHNMNIDYEIKDNNTQYSKDIVFNIFEGRKIKIKEINLIGNNTYTEKELLKKTFNNIKVQKWLFIGGKFNSENLETDLLSLSNFYNKNGFRDFRILSQDISFRDNGIYINIEIYEGNENYYNNFSFNGNKKFNDNELIEALGIEKGELFNKEKLEFSIFNMNSKYYDEGYFYLENNYEIIPSSNDSLNLQFTINENNETKVRKIIISGNDKTNDYVIRRELKIHPGDIFSMKKLQESFGDVFRLNFFETVDPQVVPFSDTKDKVDINFKVIEKETGRANFSMGYNEEFGFTGGGGFEFANFLGRGQKLSINYSRGLKQNNQGAGNSQYSNNNNDYQSFSISFSEPRINNTLNSVGFSYSHTERGKGDNSYLQYDIESDRISTSFGRKFKWPDSYFRGGWSLSYRNTKYLGDESQLLLSFSENIIKGSGENAYASRVGVSITQNISRDSRNHPEFPTDGSKISWTSTFSGNFLGGNENYHKQTFDFNWFSTLIPKFVLFQNFIFGGLKETKENEYLPYSARYLMGGSGIPQGEMLRGYGDNSIYGFLNSSGGKVMFKYSSEVRYQLSEAPTIYLFLFGEAGNVWSDFNELDIFDLKRSLGAGFRIYMPMLGILGYDVGYGFDSIDPNNTDPYGWEQHLIFGMPFN